MMQKYAKSREEMSAHTKETEEGKSEGGYGMYSSVGSERNRPCSRRNLLRRAPPREADAPHTSRKSAGSQRQLGDSPREGEGKEKSVSQEPMTSRTM